MSLKAGEVSIIIKFARDELIRYGGIGIFGAPLLGAGSTLVTLFDELRKTVAVPSPETVDAVLRAVHVHMASIKAAKIDRTPKHHLLCHMCHRTQG